MTSDNKAAKTAAEGTADARQQASRKRREPEWTSGLKQIYDSVVNEPLPDTFADLLARLDDEDQ